MAARWKLLTALWTVYLVWGSTYVAIKISVRTLPALLSAGSRFLLAGALLALILTAARPQHPGHATGARVRRRCSGSLCSGSESDSSRSPRRESTRAPPR